AEGPMHGDNVDSAPATGSGAGAGTGGRLPATELGTSRDSPPPTEPEVGAPADRPAQPDTVVDIPADSRCRTEPGAGAGTGRKQPATAVVAEDHPWLDRLRRPGEHSHHDADVSPNALGVPNSAPAQAPRERINGQKHSDASLPLAPTLPVAGAGAWG